MTVRCWKRTLGKTYNLNYSTKESRMGVFYGTWINKIFERRAYIMFIKMKLKTAMAVIMTTLALSSGTVMAMSEVMPYATAESGSETIPSGGSWETIAGGKTFPSPTFARVWVNSSSQTISASYPLFFKLVKVDDNSLFSNTSKMTNKNYPADLRYTSSEIGIQFRFKARTDKNSQNSTRIGYTVSF